MQARHRSGTEYGTWSLFYRLSLAGQSVGGFTYQDSVLCADEVPLPRLAEQFGTPTYVYSRPAIEQAWRAYDVALAPYRHLICYSVKANSNLAVLNVLAQLGSGFDIVSSGELARVLKAEGDPKKVVFSGVGKTKDEIDQALSAGIKCFNVESVSELERIEYCARRQARMAPVSLRVNPDIDPNTHPYIATGLRENKFGIAYEQALEVYGIAAGLKYIDVVGVACHIGSQIQSIAPFTEAMTRLMRLIRKLHAQGLPVRHIDAGGGLGISYGKEVTPSIRQYVTALVKEGAGREYELIIEPGRSIVGAAGVLLTRVEYIKHTEERNFAVLDAGMNDLMRPSLYDGWHDVLPVLQHDTTEACEYHLVGPICESGDVLASNRRLALQQGDLLAITATGAYGFSMSSNYNTRPRACEVMVEGEQMHLVRHRETPEDLLQGECLFPIHSLPI